MLIISLAVSKEVSVVIVIVPATRSLISFVCYSTRCRLLMNTIVKISLKGMDSGMALPGFTLVPVSVMLGLVRCEFFRCDLAVAIGINAGKTRRLASVLHLVSRRSHLTHLCRVALFEFGLYDLAIAVHIKI